MENSDKKVSLDADNYSIKNCAVSAGLASTLFFIIATPFDVVKIRILKDLNNCDPSHYNNKSLYKSLRGHNPGV